MVFIVLSAPSCSSERELVTIQGRHFVREDVVTPTPSSSLLFHNAVYLSEHFLLCTLTEAPPHTQFNAVTLRQYVSDTLTHPHVSCTSRPGECVLQRTVMVRKKLTAREGRGWLSGTLFCTHFRVAFVPQDSPKPDVSYSLCRR